MPVEVLTPTKQKIVALLGGKTTVVDDRVPIFGFTNSGKLNSLQVPIVFVSVVSDCTCFLLMSIDDENSCAEGFERNVISDASSSRCH